MIGGRMVVFHCFTAFFVCSRRAGSRDHSFFIAHLTDFEGLGSRATTMLGFNPHTHMGCDPTILNICFIVCYSTIIAYFHFIYILLRKKEVSFI